jgi:hypothetical protein
VGECAGVAQERPCRDHAWRVFDESKEEETDAGAHEIDETLTDDRDSIRLLPDVSPWMSFST